MGYECVKLLEYKIQSFLDPLTRWKSCERADLLSADLHF